VNDNATVIGDLSKREEPDVAAAVAKTGASSTSGAPPPSALPSSPRHACDAGSTDAGSTKTSW